jgi:hypothetical protein
VRINTEQSGCINCDSTNQRAATVKLDNRTSSRSAFATVILNYMACQRCMNFWTALIIISVAMLFLAAMKPGESE